MAVGQKPVHIECSKGEIAPIVIMPGDPLRAKYIARKYLKDAVLVSKVRNMFAFTGYYKDKKVTVMGHGMGMPSMSIYAYELFHFYDVESIIRIGTCGVVNPIVNVGDVVVVDKAYTSSNFAKQYDGSICNVISVKENIVNTIINQANIKNIKIHRGDNLTCDVFGPYINMDPILNAIPTDLNILTEEMEAFALIYIASKLNKKAGAIVTAVDSKFSDVEFSIEQREKTLDKMIELALDSILEL